MHSKGKKGFYCDELNALLKRKTITVVTPNTEMLLEEPLHARQAILLYLLNHTDFDKEESSEKLNMEYQNYVARHVMLY